MTYPKTMIKPIRDISQSERTLVNQRISLPRQIVRDFTKFGWSHVKDEALVSWGIVDYMNFHRLDLFQMKENANNIVRYRNADQDAVFEDCVAFFLRACVDLWQLESQSTQQINIEIQRSFEGPKKKTGSREGVRPDIFISSANHLRPVVIIECKSGQGYSRKDWEGDAWKSILDGELKDAWKHVRHIEKRRGCAFKTPVGTEEPCDIRYYKLILYMPDILQPKKSKRISKEHLAHLDENLKRIKREGVFVILKEAPAYGDKKAYLDARKEMTKEQAFAHRVEDLFSEIKKDFRL